MKKYEFTGEKKAIGLITVHRIRRISDGEIGGWIEKESNLSHEGDCWVAQDARISDNAEISGNARIYGNARISGDAHVSGNARVYGNTYIYSDARISDNAEISGNARISGDARIYGNALIEHTDNVISINCVGSENGTLTAYLTKDGIEVTRGCFRGSIDEFEQAVIKKHGDNKYGKEYMIAIQMIKLRLTK